jgi:hypothetical protein
MKKNGKRFKRESLKATRKLVEKQIAKGGYGDIRVATDLLGMVDRALYPEYYYGR